MSGMSNLDIFEVEAAPAGPGLGTVSVCLVNKCTYIHYSSFVINISNNLLVKEISGLAVETLRNVPEEVVCIIPPAKLPLKPGLLTVWLHAECGLQYRIISCAVRIEV